MTTFTPFTPSQTALFSFRPVLDGNVYLARTPFVHYAQRYYLNLSQLNGPAVVFRPLIESPASLPLASIAWANNKVTAVTEQPHGYRLGIVVPLLVAGCVPTAYNGNVQASVVDDETLAWPLNANPGTATAIGTVDWTFNLVAGYFTTSTMVFRNQQFEVNP